MNKFADILFRHLYHHYILWSFLFVIFYNLFEAANYVLYNGDLFYMDTDCYTRALRIIDWLQDFQWSEKIFPYFNVPNGFVLHYTRISDVIWVVLSLPFMAFEPLKDAIFHGGLLFSPLFFGLSLTTIFWGMRPYFQDIDKKYQIFALVFFITMLFCAKLTNIFDLSRPDHHAAMFLIFCFNIAVILRIDINQKENHLFIAGVAVGLGLWLASAVEGLILAGFVLIVLCLHWICKIFNSRCLVIFASGLFLSTTLAWMINPPYGGYGVIDIWRLSVAHVVATVLIFISFTMMDFAKIKSTSGKLSALLLGATFSGIVMFLVFGNQPTLVPVYDENITFYLPYISELGATYTTHCHFYFISWCSGILLLCYFIYSCKSQFPLALTLTTLLLITLPSGIFMHRFYQYYLTVFVYSCGLFMVNFHNKTPQDTKTRIILFIFIVGNFFALAGFRAEPQNHKFPEITGNVATDIFSAPQFSFEHGVKTIAAPYHTNIEGITDNHRLFFSTNETEIKKILQEHQIEYIYLPKEATDYYQNPKENIDKLYGKIMTGENLYPWLEFVPTDIDNAILYKIRYDLF